MTEYMQKDVLVQKMQDSYASFSVFIASLDRDQFVTPGVNGNWSIKDNLAHISAWEKRAIHAVNAVRDNRELADPTPGMSVDEINEHFYQANRTRTLEDIQSELSAVSQQLISSVQELTEAQINTPLAWNEGQNICPNILGNSVEHFEEHIQIIKSWLATQK